MTGRGGLCWRRAVQLMLLLLLLFSVVTAKGLVCNTSSSLQHALADESVSTIFVPGRACTQPSVRTGQCNIDCSGAESGWRALDAGAMFIHQFSSRPREPPFAQVER